VAVSTIPDIVQPNRPTATAVRSPPNRPIRTPPTCNHAKREEFTMPVDALTLVRSVAFDARPNYLDSIASSTDLLGRNGINTPLRLAHFFAQALLETGGFTVLRESMNYSAPRLLEIFGVNHHSAAITETEAADLAHDEQRIAERVYGLGNQRKAQELGNTQAGDGFRYRGNGVLQMTGRGAHRSVGAACGVDFEGNPDLATTAEHAMKPAVQEWTEKRLNALADQDDIRTITLRINGGFNGFADRQAWLVKLKKVLIKSGDLAPGAETGSPSEDARSLQADLNTLGADPQLAVDGILGPATAAAVKVFQAAAGLTADGIAGPVTLAAIKQGIDARR
jgi:putative chitinase